jgi:hypothetical protein
MKGDTELKARDVEGRRRRGEGKRERRGKEQGLKVKEQGLTAGGGGTSGEAARTLEKSWQPPAHSLPQKYPLSWRQQMAALHASLRQGHIGQSLLLFVCSAQLRCQKKKLNFLIFWADGSRDKVCVCARDAP